MDSRSLNSGSDVDNVILSIEDHVPLSDEDFNALLDDESYSSNSDSETQQSRDQIASAIQAPVTRHFSTIRSLGGIDSTSPPTNSSASQSLQLSRSVLPNTDTMGKEESQAEVSPEQKIEAQLHFLRGKPQKGLLSKDRQPKREEMLYLKELENIHGLSSGVLHATRKKVLKHIIERSDIPMDDTIAFKDRAGDLLKKWEASSDSEASARLLEAQLTDQRCITSTATPELVDSSALQPHPTEIIDLTEESLSKIDAKSRQSCMPDSTESSVISETPQLITSSALAALSPSNSLSDHLVADSIKDHQLNGVANPDQKSCVVVLKYRAGTNSDTSKPNSMKRKRSGAADEETALDSGSNASRHSSHPQRWRTTPRQS